MSFKTSELLEKLLTEERQNILADLAKVISYPNYDRAGKIRDEEYASALHRLSPRIRAIVKGKIKGP